jgi:hypothetical protein
LFSFISIYMLSLLSFCLAHATTQDNQRDIMRYKAVERALYVGFEFYESARTYFRED